MKCLRVPIQITATGTQPSRYKYSVPVRPRVGYQAVPELVNNLKDDEWFINSVVTVCVRNELLNDKYTYATPVLQDCFIQLTSCAIIVFGREDVLSLCKLL